jgi:hypothetical protein
VRCYETGEQKARTIILSVVGRTCRVSFVDAKGTRHTAEVVAESLYEPALQGLRTIIEGWEEEPEAGTPITVSMVPPEHVVTLRHIRSWLEKCLGTPKDMAVRHRLRELLPGEELNAPFLIVVRLH